MMHFTDGYLKQHRAIVLSAQELATRIQEAAVIAFCLGFIIGGVIVTVII